MATTNALSTPLKLIQFLRLLKTIPNKDATDKELVGIGDSSATSFWLDNLGVIESTYTFSYGSTQDSVTNLTETTDYTIDLDTSEITLTSAGVTAVGTNNIYAVYKYSSAEILNADLLTALNAAENKLLRDSGQTFTNTTALGYRKTLDEIKKAHMNTYRKIYDFYYTPVIEIATAVNGAYTTGGTTLTVDDASLLPSSGTIYIGGNKVAYTAKSSNDLTVPSATPSIADNASVRGEVIELSTESEGTAPSYTVLDPDTEYEMDYDNGRLKILSNAYYSEVDANTTIFPQNYLIRVSYLHAWHEAGKDATIPDEIEWVVNAMAARKMVGSVVSKAGELGLDDFNPSLVEVDQKEIDRVIEEYTPLNIGTSPYNKQSLS